MCHNPARLIAGIFVPTGNIVGWGRGQGRAGRGERTQGTEGWRGEKRRIRGEERAAPKTCSPPPPPQDKVKGFRGQEVKNGKGTESERAHLPHCG